MQFNSYIFILLYLPIIVVGYFILNKISICLGKLWLVIGGVAFYLYGGIKTAAILGLSIAVNLLAVQIMSECNGYRKIVLTIAVTGNIVLLFYYKYAKFFLSNWNRFFETDYTLLNLVLPIGISFFTFQQIAYLVQVYRDTEMKIHVLDYLAYILFFPKLVMGPLMEPTDFMAQLNDTEKKKVDWENIACGIKIFSCGLFKKMVLADTFAGAVAWGYMDIDAATSMDWLLIMLFYTFEIYFDFSGYSDMATGVSLMLNIRLPINFDSPYKAVSIRDFWKRWHMSLTAFLTKYVYIPLGGSKKGKIRTYLNTMIVFAVSGVWHGANWTFILWGLLHGLLSVTDRIFEKTQKKLMEAVRWIGTFLTVNVLWLLFRSDGISQWKNILRRIFSFQDLSISEELLNVFQLPETKVFADTLRVVNVLQTEVRGFWMLLFLCLSTGLCLIPENNYKNLMKNNALWMMAAAVIFFWAFICLGNESVFVYFNF